MKKKYKKSKSIINETDKRCIYLANYIINTKGTVREAAKAYGISKSTVHKDVSERLKYLNTNLYCEVRQILDQNKKERHIRGGMATKLKYKNKMKIQSEQH